MRKLYMISFEGMNPDLVEQWIDAGYLTNFKRLKREGSLGEISCSRVPYESSGLMSALSGKSDSEHGIYSYWHVHNRDYMPKVHESGEIKESCFFNQNRFSELTKAVVNVFGTHPVYEMNGYLVSYAMERTLRYTYPQALLRKLGRQGLPYVQDMGAFYKKQGKHQFMDEVMRVERMRHEVCRELLKKDLDVYIFNYTCIDRVCHFYMNELYNPQICLADTAVFQMYQYCNSLLGEYLDRVEKEDGRLIVFSSVGFGKLEHFVEINQYLAKKGLLSWSEQGRIPDWRNTTAFESVQGSHGININKAGRYAHGIINEDEFSDVLIEVMEALKEMENPYTHKPMFQTVIPGAQYYDSNPMAPDIMLEPMDWEYLPYGDTYWSDRVSRHSQSGWHRNRSVCGSFGQGTEGKKMNELRDIYSCIRAWEGEDGHEPA